MPKHRLLSRISICIFIAVFVISLIFGGLVPSISAASDKTSLESRKNILSAQLEEAKKNTQDAQALHQAYENQIAFVQEQISNTEAEMESINSQITDLQNDIIALGNKIRENKESVKQSIVVDYKTGGVSFIDVLLSNDNISDLFDKVSILNFVVENRNVAIEGMNSDISDMQKKSSELGAKQNELVQIEKEKQTQYDELKKLSDESQIQVDILQNKQNELEVDIDQVDKELADFIKQEELAEQRRKESAAKSSETYSGGFSGNPVPVVPTPSAGGWVRPIAGGYRISAGWGTTDSVHSKPHEGIDLAAPLGTPVLAANSGQVVKVCGLSGYGNSIIIRHQIGGNTYYTLYAHMSRILTSLGATVSAGQQIGCVGSTGYSTGNHLHFGVYSSISRGFGYGTGCCLNPSSFVSF